jgi:hypothetical protein
VNMEEASADVVVVVPIVVVAPIVVAAPGEHKCQLKILDMCLFTNNG